MNRYIKAGAGALVMILMALFVSVVAHEDVHAIQCWSVGGSPSFGWEENPYTKCDELKPPYREIEFQAYAVTFAIASVPFALYFRYINKLFK